jgi:hypothetical protein
VLTVELYDRIVHALLSEHKPAHLLREKAVRDLLELRHRPTLRIRIRE